MAPRQEEPDDGRMKVVTTIFPPYDFARAISGNGELAYVRMLLSPGEEIHSYEPTPLDIKEIQNCDLFIYTGGENDVWVDRILENMGEKRPQTLRLVDLTETVEEEITEGMMQERGHDHDHEEAEEHDHEAEGGHDHEEAEEHDHEAEGDHDHEGSEHANGGDSSHEEHEEADEHVWTSPVKAAEITAAIAEKMAEIDPANAEAYLANAGAYEEQILSVDAQFREIVQNAKRRAQDDRVRRQISGAVFCRGVRAGVLRRVSRMLVGVGTQRVDACFFDRQGQGREDPRCVFDRVFQRKYSPGDL